MISAEKSSNSLQTIMGFHNSGRTNWKVCENKKKMPEAKKGLQLHYHQHRVACSKEDAIEKADGMITGGDDRYSLQGLRVVPGTGEPVWRPTSRPYPVGPRHEVIPRLTTAYVETCGEESIQHGWRPFSRDAHQCRCRRTVRRRAA